MVGLDYRNLALWPAMTEAMAFWLREAGIDVFRCDATSLMPTPFWEQARELLQRIKPVFMLVESDAPELHRKAFDKSHNRDLFDQLRDIAKGQANAAALRAWCQRRAAKYPADACRMCFTANHDSNSWYSSDRESFWQPGMPEGDGHALCHAARHAAGLRRPGEPLRQAAGLLRKGSDRLK